MMIMDVLSQAPIYRGLHRGIDAALEYLQTTDFSQIAPARYELQGSELFALVQKYEGKPRAEGRWEAHRQYIDVQYIIEGVEGMGYANLGDLEICQEYNPDKDILFLQGSGNFLQVATGRFILFFPQDAHMPGLAMEKDRPIKKVVVKVRV